MSQLGGVCVGSSEIDQACLDTYTLNYPDVPQLGDIRDIDPNDIPQFDFLCAGFPCQPFSKAGKRQGFKDEERGELFYRILDVLDAHNECDFLLLENVRNLADRREYWNVIQDELSRRDFVVSTKPIILSPSDFGVPQTRERVFILGIRKRARDVKRLPNSFIVEDDLCLNKKACSPGAALTILEQGTGPDYYVKSDVEEVLFAWDEFRAETNLSTVGYPIWIVAFGLGIQFDRDFFNAIGFNNMPGWKQNYYRRNRHFYQLNRDFIDGWIERHGMLGRNKLLQKFEWNCGGDVDGIKGGVIQIRQSGVRVRRPDLFPALVAMNNTPILWDELAGHFRRITPHEAAKLQSFDESFLLHPSDKQAYKQLGNSVNVIVASQLARGLLSLAVPTRGQHG